jgi:predicted transglutaminase-like cysteine proteinase
MIVIKNIVRILHVSATLAFLTGVASAGTTMKTAGLTTQPIGHYEFCLSYTSECNQVSNSGAAVYLTRNLWSQIEDVNNQVNVMVEPVTDQDLWGLSEKWSYPQKRGDCEDYVLAKRKQLIERGIPASALLITVVRQQNGDGHAVLTVRTDRGDFVLDNLEPKILLWNKTTYRFLKRQSAMNSGQWVSITDGREISVGSVN